jgi:hypothetical protein
LVHHSRRNSPVHRFCIRFQTARSPDIPVDQFLCLLRLTHLSRTTMDKGNTQQDLPAWFAETRKKGVSVAGNALFTILRLADLPLQYYLLSSGLRLPRPLASHHITPLCLVSPLVALLSKSTGAWVWQTTNSTLAFLPWSLLTIRF